MRIARLPGWVVARRRLVIVLVHGIVISVAYVLAYLLRFDGRIPTAFAEQLWLTLPLLLLVRLATFGFYRLYSGWWRHVSVHDLSVLVRALSVSTALFLGTLKIFGHINGFSRSIILLDWGIALVLFGGMRFAVRMVSEGSAQKRWTRGGKRTLIIGAGSAGANLLRVPLAKGMAGNRHDCEVMIDQSRAIDNRRFVRRLRVLPPSILQEVEQQLRSLAEPSR